MKIKITFVLLIAFNQIIGQTTQISGVINSYTPVIAFTPCDNKITVEDASSFKIGDTVLMIQMKGAVIDSSNTANFGTIVNYKNAGNYEINYVKSKSGNIIELKNVILRAYDIPIGKVQLIRIPYYQNAVVNSTLTCLPWDGNKGGVLVLNAFDLVTLNANIDVTGKGFKGGIGYNAQSNSLSCFRNEYYYSQSNIAIAGQKGETITSLSSNINYGKGSPAGGGGGGQGHNSGGGGGSNGGSGGFGGYSLEPCGNAPFDNRGIGGHSLTYNNTTNKIFAGSGGGAGQADNIGNLPSSGGDGGGIIIIISNRLITNGNKIIANGNAGQTCSMPPSSDCHDGMGGGGAAGSILLGVNQLLDNTTIENKGGKGADMIGSVPLGGRIGAGGGGGGGLLFIKPPSLPINLTNTNAGGVNGVLTQDGGSSWGATSGANGTTLYNLSIPITSTTFKPNIDSIKISELATNCNTFNFLGSGYTNTNPINTWQWFLGDGNIANTQNTTHSYQATGTFNVKLIVTDINGCKAEDSIAITVNPKPVVTISNDTLVCSSNGIQLTAGGGSAYSWSPVATLNNASIPNPFATPSTNTTYYVTVFNTPNCSSSDSVRITVKQPNTFTISPPGSVCVNDTIQLFATSGDKYNWTPAVDLNNPSVANPTAFPTTSTTYDVLITDTVCNTSATLTTTVTVNPSPVLTVSKSNDVDCSNATSQLTVTGALQYMWYPSGILNNAAIANPIASPLATTQYFVTGKDLNGCSNTDSITVLVTANNSGNYLMPNAFTPNNDGLNDCFGVQNWGLVSHFEFSIYNRWGQLVFYTTDPANCWNGNFKSEAQNAAVYAYIITARNVCGVIKRNGLVTLIR